MGLKSYTELKRKKKKRRPLRENLLGGIVVPLIGLAIAKEIIDN